MAETKTINLTRHHNDIVIIISMRIRSFDKDEVLFGFCVEKRQHRTQLVYDHNYTTSTIDDENGRPTWQKRLLSLRFSRVYTTTCSTSVCVSIYKVITYEA